MMLFTIEIDDNFQYLDGIHFLLLFLDAVFYIAVNLDTGGTNRKKTFFALAKVSYILFWTIGSLFLVKFMGVFVCFLLCIAFHAVNTIKYNQR